MSNEHNKLYEFGKFQLDVTERVLLCEDELIILPAKVFDTLEILVKRSGKIVSKDDLMNEIWSESFVEESNLTQNIYKLRQTLGKEFIETVPRRGYRFTAFVKSMTLEKQNLSDSNIDTGLIIATRTKTHIIEQEETDFSETIENTAVAKTQETNSFGKKSILIATLATVFVFALGVIGYQSYVNQTSDSSPKALANIEFDKLTATGNAYSPVISPDGKFLAYLKANDIGKTLNLMDIELGNDVELDIGSDIKPDFLQFSPTGKRIYIRSQGRLESPQEIYETTYFGGQAKLVAKEVWGHFSISPDGNKAAFYRSKPTENKQFLIVKDLENGEEKEFAERNVTDSFYMFVSPAWSADGKKIAFVPVKEKSNRSEIAFVNLETSQEETIKTELTYIRQVAFLPNENSLILVARDKTFQIHKLNYTNGKSSRITNDVNNYRNISMTADGSKIVTQQRKLESNIWLITNADINLAEPLTEKGFYGLYDLSYTKTGNVIFDSKGDINRNLELINTKNKAVQLLSKDENTNNNHEPASDKLGNIYFVSDQSGSMNIWRVNPNGTDSKQITFGKKGKFNIAPTVSPDDKWLYFLERSGESNSHLENLSNGKRQTRKSIRGKRLLVRTFLECFARW